MHPFLPHTKEDIDLMLATIGVTSIEDLFKDIPDEIRLNGELDITPSMSEIEIRKLLTSLSDKNLTTDHAVNFMGGGAYDHYIPSIIKHLSQRQEFFTAYTPYQPEISQGTLQAIFEYQSMICELTGMDVSNASLYDGGTALAEAVFMANHGNKKDVVLVSQTVNPEYRHVIKTYARYNGLQYEEIHALNGQTDFQDLKSKYDDQVSSVVIQVPNYYGIVEDGLEVRRLMDQVKTKAQLIVSANPMSLGLLEAPGNYGADIVAGEGQPLGAPLQFGGPYLGFIAAKKGHMRRMPGRIVGETVDLDGKRAYVLTLQAREQHIRREKAMSNITSNQGLIALMATIYMATMGKAGMKEVAYQCLSKTHYLANKLQELKGISLTYDGPFFHEFVLKTEVNAKSLHEVMEEKGFLAGIVLSDHELLLCVTEKITKEQMDTFVKELEGIL